MDCLRALKRLAEKEVGAPFYCILAAAAACGAFDVAWQISIAAAFVALQAMWLPRYMRLKDKARSEGIAARWWRGLILLVLIATLTASAAYFVGWEIGLLSRA